MACANHRQSYEQHSSDMSFNSTCTLVLVSGSHTPKQKNSSEKKSARQGQSVVIGSFLPATFCPTIVNWPEVLNTLPDLAQSGKLQNNVSGVYSITTIQKSKAQPDSPVSRLCEGCIIDASGLSQHHTHPPNRKQ